jgi:hypothetical protein
MPYTAKITDARKEFSLPDNKAYMDVWFDILLDGKKVADRRLAFPMGTTEEQIRADVAAYPQMYENDHALAAETQARMEAEAEAELIMSNLKGEESEEIGGKSNKKAEKPAK